MAQVWVSPSLFSASKARVIRFSIATALLKRTLLTAASHSPLNARSCSFRYRSVIRLPSTLLLPTTHSVRQTAAVLSRTIDFCSQPRNSDHFLTLDDGPR